MILKQHYSFINLFFIMALLFNDSKLNANENSLKVITTFTVIADMAKNIAGSRAEIRSITKPGAEIHEYQPTPRDLIKAQDADLILWNGLNLELWFEKFFNNLKNIPSVVITEGITPINIKKGEYIGKPNPHAWMSMKNALIYIENIEKALSEFDSKNSTYYKDNARIYKKKIIDTITPIKKEILSIPESQRWIVSCEGAFSYLTEDFNMKELYLWPINADAQGTPQQVKNVIDKVKKHSIKAIFCESTVSQSPAIKVAEETGSKYGGVLYVDSLTDIDGIVPTYLDLLKVTSKNIMDGLMER